MRWRSKTGGEPVKTRRRKAVKRRNAPKAVRSRGSSATGQKIKIARLTHKLQTSDIKFSNPALTEKPLARIRVTFVVWLSLLACRKAVGWGFPPL